MLINKNWINCVLNSEAYSSFERVSSNQRIVLTKIRLSLRWNTNKTPKTTHYDWLLLNNRDISNKYTTTQKKKKPEFNAPQKISESLTPNDEYENFVHGHMEAGAEWIPTKIRAKHRIHRRQYLSLPPTWQGLTRRSDYGGGVKEGEGRTRFEAFALLDYAEHRFTWCNMNWLALLDMDINISPARMPDYSFNWTFGFSAIKRCQ